MIYIIIVLSSIMAFYFFIMAFIGEKRSKKQIEENDEEISAELEENENLNNSYYEMPQIEKVKDITYGIPQVSVEREENTTAQIPQIVESRTIVQTTPIITAKNEEVENTINIPSFVEKNDDKIINDDEVI